MDNKKRSLDKDLMDTYEKVWNRRDSMIDKTSLKKELSPEEESDILEDPEVVELLKARKKRIQEVVKKYKDTPEPQPKVKKFFLNDEHAEDYYKRNPKEKPDEE